MEHSWYSIYVRSSTYWSRIPNYEWTSKGAKNRRGVLDEGGFHRARRDTRAK